MTTLLSTTLVRATLRALITAAPDAKVPATGTTTSLVATILAAHMGTVPKQSLVLLVIQ